MNSKLQKAVLTQIGVTKKEFQNNVSDYRDASAGILGFTHYSDTHKFALKNQKLINELLNEMAEQMGVEILEMVKGFGVFRGEMDKDELKDLYRFLGEQRNAEKYECYNVLNVLAWLCVEQLAFELDN